MVTNFIFYNSKVGPRSPNLLSVLDVGFILSWLPFAILFLHMGRTSPFKTISDLHVGASSLIKSKPCELRESGFWSKISEMVMSTIATYK